MFQLLHLKYLSKAQSLIEVLVAIGVGIILIGSSAILIGVSLQSYNSIKQHLQANFLIRQEAEVIQALAHNNWHSMANLTKQKDYYVNLSEGIWTINPEQEINNINNVSYKRYFQVHDVYRDANGNIVQGDKKDPNTLKITIFLEYGNNSTSISFYLMRFSNNQVFHQSDWSEGEGQEGPVPNPGSQFAYAENINFDTEGQITMATTTDNAVLFSSILDTGINGGAGFNSFLWLGSFNTGGIVKFQIAFSNSPVGPWVYYGPISEEEDWYEENPNISINFPITEPASPQNNRYIRYKVLLSTSDISPRIDDIIINWSP